MSASSTDEDEDAAAAAATIDVDEEPQQQQQAKRRKTFNKALYDLFTREDVVKPNDRDGRQYVYCIACGL
jgi:hypothetical protein